MPAVEINSENSTLPDIKGHAVSESPWRYHATLGGKKKRKNKTKHQKRKRGGKSEKNKRRSRYTRQKQRKGTLKNKK